MERSLPNVLIHQFNCKQTAVRSLRFNVDGNYCITGGGDKSVKLWNPYKKLLLQTYSGHNNDVLAVDCSSDSSQIASGGLDKVVFLWDVTTGKDLRKIRAHHAQVNAVKYNDDGSILASGSVDGLVKLWDMKSRNYQPIQTLEEAMDSVTCIAMRQHEILIGSLDGKIRIYDIRNGLMHADDVASPVGSACFTNDGQCVLVACIGDRMNLLDKDTGQVLAEFKGHKNSMYRVDCALTSSDSIVVGGSEDGQVYCWDLLQGKIVEKLAHPSARVVHLIASHPDGKESRLLTAAEGTLYLWGERMPEEEQMQL